MRRPLVAVLLAILLGMVLTVPALAQQSDERRSIYDEEGLLVYVSSFEIPWARVDSLIQLQSIWNDVTEKGRELGCYVDREFLIHQTGSEFNIVFKTYYKKWSWPNENPGCGNRAYRAAVPDSTQRAAINAGSQWVFDDVVHRDEIYWEPYPDH